MHKCYRQTPLGLSVTNKNPTPNPEAERVPVPPLDPKGYARWRKKYLTLTELCPCAEVRDHYCVECGTWNKQRRY